LSISSRQEGAGLLFWDNVYGFDFSRVGREVRAETLASRAARVAAIDGSAVVTTASEFKRFDLTTMSAGDVEFNTDFVLHSTEGGACGCFYIWHAAWALPRCFAQMRRCHSAT
jgi:hypothetical protein